MNTHPGRSSAPERLASLDLLRGLAAFSVAIPHYFLLVSILPRISEIISAVAVEVFFVLSGFVLAPQIFQCCRLGRLSDIRTFLVRRWMRTVPPYIFALIIASILANNLSIQDFVRYLLYIQNLFSQYNSIDYFPVAWSLSVEEWFYVTFPILIFFLARLLRRTDVGLYLFFAIGFIAAITLLRFLFGNMDDWGPLVRRVVVFRIDSIAYGVLLYIGVQHLKKRENISSRRKIAQAMPFVTALVSAAFFITGAYAGEGNHLAERSFPFGAAMFGASAVLSFHELAPLIHRSAYASKVSYFLGKISYSVYLFHLPIALLLVSNVTQMPTIWQIGVYLTAIVTFCSIFFLYFERPILAARPNYAPAERARPFDCGSRVAEPPATGNRMPETISIPAGSLVQTERNSWSRNQGKQPGSIEY